MCFFLSQEHRFAEFVPELAEFILDSTCRIFRGEAAMDGDENFNEETWYVCFAGLFDLLCP